MLNCLEAIVCRSVHVLGQGVLVCVDGVVPAEQPYNIDGKELELVPSRVRVPANTLSERGSRCEWAHKQRREQGDIVGLVFLDTRLLLHHSEV